MAFVAIVVLFLLVIWLALEAKAQHRAGPGGDVATHYDGNLSRVVLALTGEHVPVRCWSRQGWEAHEGERRAHGRSHQGYWERYLSTQPAIVNLGPNVCVELTRLRRMRGSVLDAPWPDALAWSLEMLTHESVHARGILNEAKAECYGMQTVAAAAVALGRTSAEGRYPQAEYWKAWYPHDQPPYLRATVVMAGLSISILECTSGLSAGVLGAPRLRQRPW
jgi:hypothetical protein